MSEPTMIRRIKTILTREDLENESREGRGRSEGDNCESVGEMKATCSEDLATLPCRTDIWKRT